MTGDGDYLYDRITVPHGGYWTSTNNSTENAIGWASVIEIDPDYYYRKKELLFVRPVVD